MDWAPGPCGHPYAPMRFSDSKPPLKMVCFESPVGEFSCKGKPWVLLRFKPCDFLHHTHKTLPFLFIFVWKINKLSKRTQPCMVNQSREEPRSSR